MDQATAIKQINEACKNIALQFMKIHPAIPHLNAPDTQDELYKNVHEMTIQVESIKKRIAKIQSKDDSTVL